MSRTYSTQLAAGVRAEAIFKAVKAVTQRTKYNEDTGLPYTVEQVSYEPYLFGKHVPGLEPNPEEWKLPGGLKAFSTGDGWHRQAKESPYHRFDYSKHVIGVELAAAKENEVEVVPIHFINAKLHEATEILKANGFDGSAEVYLVNYLS